MMKYLLGVVSVLFVFYLGNVVAYFEYKFWCSVSADKVVISLTKEDDSYNKCLTIITNINKKIESVDKNIRIASSYLNSKYSKEWERVLEENVKLKNRLMKYKESLIYKMSIFEKRLFIKIKEILVPKINNLIDNISIQINKLKQDYKSYLEKGDIDTLRYLENQIFIYNSKLLVLELMKKAESFEELVPVYRLYLKLKDN